MAFTGTSILILAIGMVAGYLLGSVNFAIIITRLFGKGDIRKYGSGNAGMTNAVSYTHLDVYKRQLMFFSVKPPMDSTL